MLIMGRLINLEESEMSIGMTWLCMLAVSVSIWVGILYSGGVI